VNYFKWTHDRRAASLARRGHRAHNVCGMNSQFPQPGADLSMQPPGRSGDRLSAQPAASIYDDLRFGDEPIRVEAPPPIEIREAPIRFSLLQLFALMTFVALVCVLIHFVGFRRGVWLALLLTAIGSILYVKAAPLFEPRRPPWDSLPR
jgi:hypothetical protein